MFGGEEGAAQRTENAEELLKTGVNLTGKVNISKGSRFKGGDVMKYGTEEQKAAWMKFQKEEEERSKITDEKRAELKPIENAIDNLKNNKLYIKPRSKQDRNKLPQLNALGKLKRKDYRVYWNKFKQNMTTDMENHILLLIKLQLEHLLQQHQ